MRCASRQGRDRPPECDIGRRRHVLARSAVLVARVMTHSVFGGSEMTIAHTAIHTSSFGPRTRRVVRSVARIVNPAILLIAGRRGVAILGIRHHGGRRPGRAYATPLGMRPLGNSFIMPRT